MQHQLVLLVLAASLQAASAQLLGNGDSGKFLYIGLLICVPIALGTIFFLVCGRLCRTEQEKLEANIIMGVPVIVFIEEGRDTISSTDEVGVYMTGTTPIAQPVYDFEVEPSVAPVTVSSASSSSSSSSSSGPSSCSAA
ncbi:hypothetical protein SDRG_10262 [Saprolegnia diclina VS20]|uniref:Uncharacterized protein n=1 Tax=Saprolegnia diclina (strain VS20) TaxID=1156394 RepID=T0QER0_SAPDV|nr:hypothetical protein SDRG_10262 [Saprolegnia diclina VS20]EQC32065.1 hypothetical protein SDRG_10262 [Saprolegnia diclina VS20]|eukprot:XP_008614467.1 hypothetical protein SDRG_10262 [Saprolegnia diclina VS20]